MKEKKTMSKTSTDDETAVENPEVIVPPEGADISLVTAVADAMSEAGEVTKSSENKDQKYKFASAEAILKAVRLPLLHRGVILSMHPREYETSTIKADGRGTRIVATIDFTFRNGSGESLTIEGWRGVGEDYGDKAIGKAYTSAVKTFIRSQWLLPTEHDDPETADNVAPPAPDLPAWAHPASKPRKAELLALLEPVIGKPRAVSFGQMLADSWQSVPDGAVAIAKALMAELHAELGDDLMLLANVAADRRAQEAAQQAAGETPDPESPAEQPDPPAPSPEVELEQPGDSDVSPSDPAINTPPDPSSVTPPDVSAMDPDAATDALRAAGCTCPDPLAEPFEGTCPLIGHGIPF